MSATEMPRITDPELIRVAAEPTSSTEYVVQVDVLDAVLPDLLRALASDAVLWREFRGAVSECWLRSDAPLTELVMAQTAESLRQHGVGVLHLTPDAASSVGYDLDAPPDRCEVGPCDLNSEADLAGMCRIHDTDADDIPPRGE